MINVSISEYIVITADKLSLRHTMDADQLIDVMINSNWPFNNSNSGENLVIYCQYVINRSRLLVNCQIIVYTR